MKIFKTIIIFCVATIICAGVIVAKADTTSTNQVSEYLFHLYLDTSNQLVADRNFKFSYDVVSSQFTQPSVGQFPYSGQIVDFTGAVAANFKFNVQSGKLSVYAPYVADGQKVIFYDQQNNPILTIPVSSSSFCNDDGICNADRGEDSLTCPKDCKAGTLPAPTVTTSPSTGTTSSGLLSGIIYTVVGIGLLGGLWWFIKKRRGGGQSPSISLPTNQMPQYKLPTPPPPPPPQNPL